MAHDHRGSGSLDHRSHQGFHPELVEERLVLMVISTNFMYNILKHYICCIQQLNVRYCISNSCRRPWNVVCLILQGVFGGRVFRLDLPLDGLDSHEDEEKIIFVVPLEV